MTDVILEVHDLARGGAGVCREESGRIVFVPWTMPGDRVRVRIHETRKNRYAHGELLEVIQPSPSRQKPPCPVFTQCGGCEWQHLPYQFQWETKKKGVEQALARAQLKVLHLEEVPATQVWEYRNRIQLRGHGAEIGFFKPGSRDLVPAKRCDIARKEINAIWEETRQEGMSLRQPYKVEVEVLASGKVQKTWNAKHSALGFRQIHDEQNDRLKAWVNLQLPEGDVLYDLFGGSGNFSLPLAFKMKEVHCVDWGAPDVAPHGTPRQIQFHRAPVGPWLTAQAKRTASITEKNSRALAILDPPREGLGDAFQEIAIGINLLHVKKMIIVGCDTDSWVRDLSRWVKEGWIIHKVMILDLFPQTHHVECLAVLDYL